MDFTIGCVGPLHFDAVGFRIHRRHHDPAVEGGGDEDPIGHMSLGNGEGGAGKRDSTTTGCRRHRWPAIASGGDVGGHIGQGGGEHGFARYHPGENLPSQGIGSELADGYGAEHLGGP